MSDKNSTSATQREPVTVACNIVEDHIFLVRVSARKFRLAQIDQDGSGYSATDAAKPGLSNVRVLRFLGEPLSILEAHSTLHAYTVPGTFTSYDPVLKNTHGRNATGKITRKDL